MRNDFSTIVIGLGAMGTSACYHLASRGEKVLGLEQFSLCHDRGSSHGETRLIRKAYFENPAYVPLLLRAYELWDELAEEAGEKVLERCGLVIFGRKESSQVFQGTLRSGSLYKIPVEEFSREDAMRKFPMFAPPKGYSAAYEAGAGFLHAERAVLAHANAAKRRGAELHEQEVVKSYEAGRNGVRVLTNRGTYSADRLVVAGGGWSSRLLQELGLPLKLRRMLLGWFRAGKQHEGAPGFIFDLEDDFYYGFPQIDGETIKIAGHHGYQLMESPEEKDSVAPAEARIEALRNCIRSCLPYATGDLIKAAHCIYTMTPDENFVIDRHEKHPEVVYAAGFSGHGFKFASVVGEILADLSIEGKTHHPVNFLRAARFGNVSCS